MVMGHQSPTRLNWFNYINFLMADKDQLLCRMETIICGQERSVNQFRGPNLCSAPRLKWYKGIT